MDLLKHPHTKFHQNWSSRLVEVQCDETHTHTHTHTHMYILNFDRLPSLIRILWRLRLFLRTFVYVEVRICRKELGWLYIQKLKTLDDD